MNAKLHLRVYLMSLKCNTSIKVQSCSNSMTFMSNKQYTMLDTATEIEIDGFPWFLFSIPQPLIQSELSASDLNEIHSSSNELTELTPAISPQSTHESASLIVYNARRPSDSFVRCVNAARPTYITLQSRLATFQDWKNPSITPSELSEAGFIFIGTDDIVSCFHCNAHIKDWIAGDNAWVEHAKFSPFCTFIYIKCGLRFINSCLRGETTPRYSTLIIEPENDRYKCKVCLEKEVGVCFYPCEHCVTCIDCAPGIDTCPICREEISGVFRMKLID